MKWAQVMLLLKPLVAALGVTTVFGVASWMVAAETAVPAAARAASASLAF